MTKDSLAEKALSEGLDQVDVAPQVDWRQAKDLLLRSSSKGKMTWADFYRQQQHQKDGGEGKSVDSDDDDLDSDVGTKWWLSMELLDGVKSKEAESKADLEFMQWESHVDELEDMQDFSANRFMPRLRLLLRGAKSIRRAHWNMVIYFTTR